MASPSTYQRIPTDEVQDFPEAQSPLLDSELSDSRHKARDSWSFVEAGWFQTVSALIIFINVVLMIVETAMPEVKGHLIPIDRMLLCFYVFELVSRMSFFRDRFFFGPVRSVSWNVLDFVVVTAGMLDELVVPILPVKHIPGVQELLQILRCLRILRVLKIIRIFLESDLSWTESPKFQSFTGIVIAFNSLLMGMETDIQWAGWFYIEQVLLIIYVFELAVRFKRFGLSFLSCSNPDIIWNMLDFTIVVTSTIDSWIMPLITLVAEALSLDDGEGSAKQKSGMSFGQAMMMVRMMRLLRILRLVKLVKSVRPLYILVTSMVAACQGVAWVLVLTLVVLYAMGIMSTRLIGHGMVFPQESDVPEHVIKPFVTVPDSMFTLFRVMSGSPSDDEAHALDALMVELPTIKFAFVFFMITSSWTLLSILTAVVSENMISTTGEQEYEMKLASDEEDRAHLTNELRELFEIIDISGDGHVDKNELHTFLSCKENAVRCAKSCRVPVRYIKDVFEHLSVDGKPVNMTDFTQCLIESSKTATERSIMRIEALLKSSSGSASEACKDNVDLKMDVAPASFLKLLDSFDQKLKKQHELLLDGFHSNDRVAKETAHLLRQISVAMQEMQIALALLPSTINSIPEHKRTVPSTTMEQQHTNVLNPSTEAHVVTNSYYQCLHQSCLQEITAEQATPRTLSLSLVQEYEEALESLKLRVDQLLHGASTELITAQAECASLDETQTCGQGGAEGIEIGELPSGRWSVTDDRSPSSISSTPTIKVDETQQHHTFAFCNSIRRSSSSPGLSSSCDNILGSGSASASCMNTCR